MRLSLRTNESALEENSKGMNQSVILEATAKNGFLTDIRGHGLREIADSLDWAAKFIYDCLNANKVNITAARSVASDAKDAAEKMAQFFKTDNLHRISEGKTWRNEPTGKNSKWRMDETEEDDIENDSDDWEPVPKEWYDDEYIKRLDAFDTSKWKKSVEDRKKLIDKIGKLAYMLKTDDDFKTAYLRLDRSDRQTVKFLVDDKDLETRKAWAKEVMEGGKDGKDFVADYAKEGGKKVGDLKNVTLAMIYGLGFDD